MCISFVCKTYNKTMRCELDSFMRQKMNINNSNHNRINKLLDNFYNSLHFKSLCPPRLNVSVTCILKEI